MLRSGATLVLLPRPPTPCAAQQPGTVMEILSGNPWSGLKHCCSSPTPAGSVTNSHAPSRLRVGRRGDRRTGLTTAGVASRSCAPTESRLRQARPTYRASFCCIAVRGATDYHNGPHFQSPAWIAVRPPTLIKLLVVWIYIRPPATAGVLCVTSPNGVLAHTWNGFEQFTD